MTKEDILEQLILFTSNHNYIPELDELSESLHQEESIITSHFTTSDEICVFYFEQLIDEYIIYVAPKLMGKSAMPLLDLVCDCMDQAKPLHF